MFLTYNGLPLKLSYIGPQNTPLYRRSFRWHRLPNFCVILLESLPKYHVNYNTVCGEIQYLPWRNIWLCGDPVEVLNDHLSLVARRCVPTKVIQVRKKDMPWFNDQCRRAFGLKQKAHLRWTHDLFRVNRVEFSCKCRKFDRSMPRTV